MVTDKTYPLSHTLWKVRIRHIFVYTVHFRIRWGNLQDIMENILTFTLRLLLLQISDSWCWCCDCNRRFEWFHDSGSWFYDYNMPMRIGRNRLDSSSRLHLFCRLSVSAGCQSSTNELPSLVLWMRCQFKNLTLMWILEPLHIRISIVVISWCQNLNFITRFWSWFWCFLDIVFFSALIF